MLQGFFRVLQGYGRMGFELLIGIGHFQAELQMFDHLLKMEIALFAMTQPDAGVSPGLRPTAGNQ